MSDLTMGDTTTDFRDVVEIRTGHGSLFTEDGVEAAVFMVVKSVPNGEDENDESMVEEVMFCVPAKVAARLYNVLKFTMVHPSIIGQLEVVQGSG